MDICLIVMMLVIFLIAYYFRPRDPSLPPGPRPLPIIGNLLGMMLFKKNILKRMRDGQAKYGDIMTSYLGPYRCITIHGYKNIYEAFVTQADVFSGRAKFLPGIQGVKGKGIVSEDGEPWRKMRRFTLRCLRDLGFGKRLIEDKIIEECKFLNREVEKMNQAPLVKPILILNKATSNIICSLIFGNRFEYTDPEFVELLDKLRISTRTGGIFPLEWLFPFIKYIRKGLGMKQLKPPHLDFMDYARSFTRKQIEEHRKTFDADNVRDFVDIYLKVQTEEQDSNIDEEDMFATIIDLLFGGSETSSTTLDWALLYMMEYPDVQTKCQNEIDRVVGRNREVRWSDRASLPYLEATMHEIQRYATIFPMGVGHCTTEDTEFKGYRIPAQTIIMGDLYSALNDPDYWENPDQFSPDRFLDGDGKLRNVEAMIPFSIGPRVCLGESLAKMELFLFFGNMLHQYTFTNSAPVDWSTETFSLAMRAAPYYKPNVQKRE